MANHTVTTLMPRRQIFRASAVLLLIGTTAPAVAIEFNPDAHLLELCVRYQILEADRMRFQKVDDVLERTPEADAARFALEAIYADYDGVMREIADTPARTIEGLRAKAQAAMLFHGGSESDFGNNYPHERIEWSLFEDAAAFDSAYEG